MTRPALTLLTCLCLGPPASASLAPHKLSPPALAKDAAGVLVKAVPDVLVPSATARGPAEEYTVSDQTEVKLDGRPCAYKDVPRGASILRIELAADRKTILRIHFRSRK
jgi:hypothetical protein